MIWRGGCFGTVSDVYLGWEAVFEACKSRALQSCSPEDAARRISVALIDMRCLSAKATEAVHHWGDPDKVLQCMACECLPHLEFTTTCARILLAQLPKFANLCAQDYQCATPAVWKYVSSHIVATVCEGIGALTGDDALELQHNIPLFEHRLCQIHSAVRDQWPSDVCSPEAYPSDLFWQISSWMSSNRSANSCDDPLPSRNLFL